MHEITVNGVPFTLAYDANGQYVIVAFEKVSASNTPTVIIFDPPIGPISTIDFGLLYQQIMSKLP